MKVQTLGNPKNPALLFFHAFPFTAEMWKEQMQHFSKKYFCVAPNLPGFGSELPDHAITFEYYADCVLEFLKISNIQKSTWCGLSMGGYLALRLYERAPELCQSLVLCDTKAGPDTNEAKLKRWDSIKLLKKDRKEFVQAQWKALTGEKTQANSEIKKKFEGMIDSVSNEGIAAGLVALATRNDSTQTLVKIKVPTLILVGDEDKVTPPSESEGMKKSISSSQMKLIANSGHLSHLENPQEFNQALEDFLTKG